ncbi:MAG: ATP-binding protein [Acidimicrobiia bacterium]|nr:ATP-binding protein [Acidimicrobiia bacterium]
MQSDFDDQITEIVAARRFAEQTIGVDHARLADILVIVSELASNAVRHAHSKFSVRVCNQRGVVRIEVTDHGDGWPEVPRREEVVSGGGMGLNLVAALSDRWGATERPGGKVVWAELDDGPALRVV